MENQAIPELDNVIKKVIVYYIDIIDEVEIMNFIKEDDSTTVEIELRDLKSILDDVVISDYAEFHAEEIAGGYAVAIDKFMSDRVLSKIAEFNQKAFLNSSAKKPYKPIEISEEGLELIEFLSFYSSEDKYILKLKVDYIKHNTTVAFPTILFVKNEIDEIPYKITSKNNPDVVEGCIKVKS